MAAITIRNLDDEVQRRLKIRAAAHDRSMEAEARAILSAAVSGRDLPTAWLDAVSEFGGSELVLPGRSAPRRVDVP